MGISGVTRRDIFDAIIAGRISWNGRLSELEFLSRIFDLKNMPSTDHRFPNAYEDIFQHRINNCDWGDDWIFYDERFNPLQADDETF
ncbi:MAG: hypothetical protein AAB048_00535, partial [Planctomycetota bacterium]